ncbi:MAG: FAD-binding oxidoreductase [Phycisphaerales bacterium]|nr:FAD-binding oxidoreductase [Phycisphaerales bacterium]
MLVNDVHSELNATEVSRVDRPSSAGDVQEIVRRAAAGRQSLCVSGARHAMGGQQFASRRALVDMRGMSRVLSMDHERGLVTAESGIAWPALIEGYLAMQRAAVPGAEPAWGIAQKQTGADDLTLGGALAANAHGRGLTMPPIVADVESFRIVNAQGELVECSRSGNSELFALAIGGYGLFGIITDVTLRLVPRVPVRRVVRLIDIDDAVNAARRRVEAGFTYGDFQFDIDPASRDFLTKGVFSCYEPVPGASPPAHVTELSPQDWERLLLLAHTDKPAAFTRYAQHYLSTDGQIYWSDTHQLGTYLDGYHERIDAALGSPCRCSEMISELYVPHDRLIDFLHAAARMLAGRGADVIYGTIRLVRRDSETFLPWARRDQACVIFNLHVRHTSNGIAHAADSFRALIDLALERSGSFFLTYHRWATRGQLLAAYPELPRFLERKRVLDPSGTFRSDWHGWLCHTVLGGDGEGA